MLWLSFEGCWGDCYTVFRLNTLFRTFDLLFVYQISNIWTILQHIIIVENNNLQIYIKKRVVPHKFWHEQFIHMLWHFFWTTEASLSGEFPMDASRAVKEFSNLSVQKFTCTEGFWIIGAHFGVCPPMLVANVYLDF